MNFTGNCISHRELFSHCEYVWLCLAEIDVLASIEIEKKRDRMAGGVKNIPRNTKCLQREGLTWLFSFC